MTEIAVRWSEMGTESIRRSLSGFNGAGYDKGRSVAVQAMWFAVLNLVFMKWWLPGWVRPIILRAFGAKVGPGVLIRHRVRVLWPWKLEIGHDSWIGEDVWLLNLEPIVIGANVCLSQGVQVCTGSHKRRSPTFEYDNRAIFIGDGAWLAIGALILRGSRVGRNSVVAARQVVSGEVPAGSVLR